MRSDHHVLYRFTRGVLLAAAVAVLCAMAHAAGAQAYPSKAVRFIVPFAPGGSTDILARLIAQKLAESWTHPVIVENRPGAATVIGTELVVKSPPDGHTVLFVSTSTTTTPSLMKLPYDAVRDLAPVIQLVFTPNVLVVHPSVPAKNVGELIQLARARPGEVAFGSGGNGTSPHLTGEILRLSTGVNMVHVPYKGAAPSIIGLLTGEVSWAFVAILPTMPQIKAGRLRAIAVSSAKRTAVLPEVPAVAETVPGFDSSPWTGVAVPAATPREIVTRLNQDIARALRLPDSRARLAEAGNELVAGSPEAFTKFYRDEIAKWARVIREAGLKSN